MAMGLLEPGKPSLKERQWQLREDTILDAASELMATKGYTAMTMDDIANLVGISKATLYQHFPSKHDLVVMVACRTSDRAYARMAAINPELPPKARVSQLIDTVVEVRYGPDSPPVIEAVGELVEVLGSDHPYMLKERRNTELMLDVLRQAEKANAVIPKLSIEVAVHVILGALRCIELEKVVGEGRLGPDLVADSIKRMILRA
jgi:AcrR family transcriptional regulator